MQSAHPVPSRLPRVSFQPPEGPRRCVSVSRYLAGDALATPSLVIFQLFSALFFRHNRVGNGSLQMYLKQHLFVPKGVYKLDARVAERFTGL